MRPALRRLGVRLEMMLGRWLGGLAWGVLLLLGASARAQQAAGSIRGVVWDRFDLGTLLDFYGTAGERWRMRAQPEQGYLPGFAPIAVG